MPESSIINKSLQNSSVALAYYARQFWSPHAYLFVLAARFMINPPTQVSLPLAVKSCDPSGAVLLCCVNSKFWFVQARHNNGWCTVNCFLAFSRRVTKSASTRVSMTLFLFSTSISVCSRNRRRTPVAYIKHVLFGRISSANFKSHRSHLKEFERLDHIALAIITAPFQ